MHDVDYWSLLHRYCCLSRGWYWTLCLRVTQHAKFSYRVKGHASQEDRSHRERRWHRAALPRLQFVRIITVISKRELWPVHITASSQTSSWHSGVLICNLSPTIPRGSHRTATGLSPTFRPSLPECYGKFLGSKPSQHVEMVSGA